jgi:hypothetical protein
MAKRQPNEKKENEISTTAECERRVNIVYEMLLSGLSRYEITNGLEKLGIKVCYRQITNYIQEANKLINSYYENNRADLTKEFLSKYNMLYKRTVAVKDFKTAAAILEKQTKMLGIAEPSENDTTDNEITINHTIVTRTETTNPSLDFTDNGD